MFSAKKAIPILLLICLCFPGVMAQTVSFAEPNTVTHQDVYLYAANGTLLGLYNTTSTGIVVPNGTDFIFTLKPQYDSPLDNPGDFLSGAVSWFETNALSLLILAACGGLLLKRF
jgi:hypothetical protein